MMNALGKGCDAGYHQFWLPYGFVSFMDYYIVSEIDAIVPLR